MPEHALDTVSSTNGQSMPSNQVVSSIDDFSQSAQTTQAAIVDQGSAEQLPNYADLYPPPPLNYQAVFTGSGKEYFKIWIVNLCLSLLSLGIYSAWAKVRRLQYFDRNTQLAGACFNFHGDPTTILRGRIIAAILLFLYHYVFGLSKGFALVFASLLFFGLPWMMRSALRFRLRNTSYRGLRFDFHGALSTAYAIYLPIAIIFVLPALIAVLFPLSWFVALPGLLYLSWPWLHARMKYYQHNNFGFGQKKSKADISTHAFVWPYFVTFFNATLVAIIGGIIFALGVSIFLSSGTETDVGFSTALIGIISSALIGLLVYSVLGPFLQTKIWNASWNHTQLDDIQFQSNLPVWGYTRLQTVNALLTICTLGLYRPFAVVRSYRFRLEHMLVIANADAFETTRSSTNNENATAESSAEFFGFDLSW
ncbi:YjgN family protein [Undibacterium baiyunense]|uniref:DUF898 domain-containing protein n=1 Tax=Undibacterium baiyunense TaxID=2828731 RepID=A0A941DIQ9_9BURK|nr:YjgN family protein [Undibacterium baiyunense]MBR7747647.1 DUF898 domain-containing protein [Undibacterium baiyunense]